MEKIVRTVTGSDLDAFQAAAKKLSRDALRLQKIAHAAIARLQAALHSDNFDDEFEACVCAEAVIDKQYTEAALEYESHAIKFLSEGRKKGEAIHEFVLRIYQMSEAELLLTPIRNGLRLNLAERG